MRDYENLKSLYSSLLNRKLEADIALSMEQKQKGEQFRVLDSAKTPVKPVDPDIKKVILLALVLGLGLGGGLAYLMEFLDTSYKHPEDAEKELQIPVMVSIPLSHTQEEQKQLFRRQVLTMALIVLGFMGSAAGIVLGVKGFRETVTYVESLVR
jgi:hypothetical protein